MYRTTIHAAKTNLSRLIERALSGEEVIISAGRCPLLASFPWPHPRRPFECRVRFAITSALRTRSSSRCPQTSWPPGSDSITCECY